MNEEFKHIEDTEAWLKGELSGEPLRAFEKKMETDPAFAAEVEMWRDMMTSIELAGEERMKQNIHSVQEKLQAEDFFAHQTTLSVMKNETKTGSGRWFAIAASVLLLVAAAAYFLFPKDGGDPKEAFAQYYKPESKALPGILDRLEAKGLADPTKAADDSLAQALKFYGDAKWEEARSSLDVYLQNHPDEPLAQLYMGLSLLQLSDYAKASRFLTPLADKADFPHQNMAKWYLALCYSQFNAPDSLPNARKLLKDLAGNPDSGYYKEAVGYLRLIGE